MNFGIIFMSFLIYICARADGFSEDSCYEYVFKVLEKLSDIEEKLEKQNKRICLLEKHYPGQHGCGNAPNIANGRILNLTGTNPADTFSVACNKGFKLEGRDTVECDGNGNWNQLPSCVPIKCGVPVVPSNSNICSMKGDTLGATVKLECDEGFYMSGNPVITCSSDGRWTQIPSCEILETCISTTSINSSFTNVASGKNVKLSSIQTSVSPGSLMVDGSRSRSWPCACTSQSRHPYAVLDLLEEYNIHFMYIVNRDVSPERLHDLVVFVGNDMSNMTLVARQKAAVGANCSLKFDRPVRGRYVKLQIEANADEFLTVCELEIYSL